MCFDAVVGLNGTFVQHRYEHAGEHEQCLFEVLIRTHQGRRIHFRLVEMSQGDGIGHVRQLRQILGRFITAEKVDEPGKLLRFECVKVDHKDDG